MEIKFFTRILLLILVLFLGCNMVIFSDTGMIQYWRLKKELVGKQNKITCLEHKIKDLEKDVKLFLADDFEVERIARQDLQMGFAHEQVYLF